jgi:hypothetical protein
MAQRDVTTQWIKSDETDALLFSRFSCSLVPYVALIEAGADFDVHIVDFRRGAHLTPEYLRVNPKHQVPVLIVNGEPLTESVAILLWVARHFPQAQLLPIGDLSEFKAIALMDCCDSGIHPHLTPNVLPERYCDLPGSEVGVRRCAHRMLREKFFRVYLLICAHPSHRPRQTITAMAPCATPRRAYRRARAALLRKTQGSAISRGKSRTACRR